MINAIIEFFAVNFAWVFWLALYYTPENTPDWINLLLFMVLMVFISIALIALSEDID